MLSTHDIIHLGNGGNVGGLPAETIFLTASVTFEDEDGRPAGRVVVAAYVCPWEEFCCYGRSTFTKQSLFPSPTVFPGAAGDFNFYYEQYDVWADTIEIGAVGPPEDMPCTQTCVYRCYRRDIAPFDLYWQLLNTADNSHVVCPDGDCPPTPLIDPMYEGQRLYVPCA